MTSLLKSRLIESYSKKYSKSRRFVTSTSGKTNVENTFLFDNSDASDEEIVESECLELPDVRYRTSNSVEATSTKYIESCTETFDAVRKPYKDDPGEEWDVFSHKIEPEDSLQSLALKYGVTVSDIKRLNKFMNDQDFYALRSIKIPIRKHGILSELLANKEGNVEESSLNNSSSDSDSNSCVRTIHLGIGNKVNGIADKKSFTKFFQNMDQDLEKIIDTSSTYKSSLDEVASTLTCKRFQPLVYSKSSFRCIETDTLYEWRCLIFIVVIFILAIPILFFLYIKSGKSLSFS